MYNQTSKNNQAFPLALLKEWCFYIFSFSYLITELTHSCLICLLLASVK